jgi:hypothetical protein
MLQLPENPLPKCECKRFSLLRVRVRVMTTERHWMDGGCGRLCHEVESLAAHTFVHHGERGFVVSGHQCNVTTPVS